MQIKVRTELFRCTASTLLFKYRIVLAEICILKIRCYRVFAKPTNILSRCTNNGYICMKLDPKRDNHYLPKLFCTVHASGRIFMRNLNISVVVLGSHTQMSYSLVREIIETVEGTSVYPILVGFLEAPLLLLRYLYSLSSLERASFALSLSPSFNVLIFRV